MDDDDRAIELITAGIDFDTWKTEDFPRQAAVFRSGLGIS